MKSDSDQIAELLAGKDVTPPKGWQEEAVSKKSAKAGLKSKASSAKSAGKEMKDDTDPED